MAPLVQSFKHPPAPKIPPPAKQTSGKEAEAEHLDIVVLRRSLHSALTKLGFASSLLAEANIGCVSDQFFELSRETDQVLHDDNLFFKHILRVLDRITELCRADVYKEMYSVQRQIYGGEQGAGELQMVHEQPSW
ncbi:hypothetical protein SUNI508_05698 [Seiridium unicorne]|uniref:Homeodomain transcription factor HD2 n=1 Tax=Seiridium unicorne TaxID=138068 RepID=A0ABR2V3H1_9PEZI